MAVVAANIPLLDAQGNIQLHIRSDLTVDIKPGVKIGTLADRTLMFEVPRRNVRHELAVHPLDATWRIISIPMDQLRNVRTGDPFVLIDRTGGGYKVWWEGTFRRRGE
jgi:hypothetical protein